MANVTLTEAASGVSVTGRMGAVRPSPTGGSVVTELERAGFKPLTVGENVELLRQSFDIILDGFPSRSIEGDVAALRRMKGQDQTEAGLIVVRVAGPPSIARQDLEWLVDGLESGDETFTETGSSGELLRFAFQVTLVEANLPVESTVSKVRVLIYHAKKGDTLRTIAHKKLGSAKRWKEIAVYNGLRDPNKKIPAGRVIRIPKR